MVRLPNFKPAAASEERHPFFQLVVADLVRRNSFQTGIIGEFLLRDKPAIFRYPNTRFKNETLPVLFHAVLKTVGDHRASFLVRRPGTIAKRQSL